MARKRGEQSRRSVIGAEIEDYISTRRKLEQRGAFYNKFVARMKQGHRRISTRVNDYTTVEKPISVALEEDEHTEKAGLPRKSFLSRMLAPLRSLVVFEQSSETTEDSEEHEDTHEASKTEQVEEDLETDGAKLAKKHKENYSKILKKHAKPKRASRKSKEEEFEAEVDELFEDDAEPAEETEQEETHQKRGTLFEGVRRWILERHHNEEDDASYSLDDDVVEEELQDSPESHAAPEVEEQKPTRPKRKATRRKKTSIDKDIEELSGMKDEIAKAEKRMTQRKRKK